MSRKVTLIFDCPGPWDTTWYREVVNGRQIVTHIQKNATIEVDLDDGSLRSQQMKEHIGRGTCRVMSKPKPTDTQGR